MESLEEAGPDGGVTKLGRSLGRGAREEMGPRKGVACARGGA